jgi:peptidoglycan hydrolase-like protein with peptidoglycan-binding domain
MQQRRVLRSAAAGALVATIVLASPAAAGTPTVSAGNPGNGAAASPPPVSGGAPSAEHPGPTVPATPALVRQVQFMLLSIGLDPGPIDGLPRRLTNAAVHKFEGAAGLPASDLVSDGQISTAFLDRLRKAASGVLLGAQSPPSPAPAASAAAEPAVASTPAPPPAASRFAACPFDAADFRIGGTQYTPDSFLQTGFAGSTETAVASLTDRLQEARQVAQQIGGPALKEVQRQARVLHYFECRLRIEQASAGKN